MKRFPDSYHEPFFMSYVEEDLNAIFEEAGFEKGPIDPFLASRSKVMCWVKPGKYNASPDELNP